MSNISLFNAKVAQPTLADRKERAAQIAAELTLLRPEYRRTFLAYNDYLGTDEMERMSLKIEMDDACRLMISKQNDLEDAVRSIQ